MNASPKQFLRILLGMVISVLTIDFAFNWIVDPYDVTHAMPIDGFNRNKPLLAPSRHKSHELKCLHPRTLLLGTSRAHAGLDPNHPGLPQVDGPIYNGALGGSNIHASLEMMRFAHAQERLARVVIGLDFVAFNANLEDLEELDDPVFADMPTTSRSKAVLSRVRMAISSKSTSDSLLTVVAQKRAANACTNDGGFTGAVDSPVRGGARRASLATERSWLSTTYAKYTLSMVAFEEIVRFARAERIDLRLFLSPSHARQYEMISVAGLWPRFEQWKRELVRVIDDDPQIVLWDFSGYNSVTTETVPPLDDPTPMTFFRESVHYRKVTGDLVLDRVMGHVDRTGARVVPPDFGVVLRKANLEEQLEATRSARERYRRTHEGEHRELREVVESVRRAGKSVGTP